MSVIEVKTARMFPLLAKKKRPLNRAFLIKTVRIQVLHSSTLH